VGGSGGFEFVDGSTGSQSITGGSGGNESIWGALSDTIHGGTAGNETIGGVAGETIIGGAANTFIDVSGGNASVLAGGGNETIWSGAHDTVQGLSGGSALIGFAGGNETFWDDGATTGRHDSISTFSQAGGDRVSLNSATDPVANSSAPPSPMAAEIRRSPCMTARRLPSSASTTLTAASSRRIDQLYFRKRAARDYPSRRFHLRGISSFIASAFLRRPHDSGTRNSL
jgi:hypothetical protein